LKYILHVNPFGDTNFPLAINNRQVAVAVEEGQTWGIDIEVRIEVLRVLFITYDISYY